jgi:hypothetical protein
MLPSASAPRDVSQLAGSDDRLDGSRRMNIRAFSTVMINYWHPGAPDGRSRCGEAGFPIQTMTPFGCGDREKSQHPGEEQAAERGRGYRIRPWIHATDSRTDARHRG